MTTLFLVLEITLDLEFKDIFIHEYIFMIIKVGGSWTTMELVIMTFIRCLALLHCYYHFKKVHRVGSSLIMKITLAYLAFTMILYSLIVFGMMGPEFDNVKESWFLIMLFTDIPKVRFLNLLNLCCF